ncbi:MAG: hypothetical protein ACI39R_06130 [Lachnospiraceae bacterium]
MKEKLNLIHWLLVADVVICIAFHRIALMQVTGDGISPVVANGLQITIYGAILLIMATFAGIAVCLWKKVENVDNHDGEKFEFPKLSFCAAVAAILAFSMYWML